MTARSALRRGQRIAERLMVDECVISRPTGEPDPLTGLPPLVEVYRGRCKVGGDRPHETDQSTGGASLANQVVILHIPADATALVRGDVVRIVSSPEQPRLVGQQYRVAGPDLRTFQTAQRVFAHFHSA